MPGTSDLAPCSSAEKVNSARENGFRERPQDVGVRETTPFSSLPVNTFSQKLNFSFLFSDVGGRHMHTSRAQSWSASPPPGCGFTFHWVCPPLQSLCVRLSCIKRVMHCLFTLLSAKMSKMAVIFQFLTFSRLHIHSFLSTQRTRSPRQRWVSAQLCEVNYGARLQLKNLNLKQPGSISVTAELLVCLEQEDYRSQEGKERH